MRVLKSRSARSARTISLADQRGDRRPRRHRVRCVGNRMLLLEQLAPRASYRIGKQNGIRTSQEHLWDQDVQEEGVAADDPAINGRYARGETAQ
jgi:hypothetical protein